MLLQTDSYLCEAEKTNWIDKLSLQQCSPFKTNLWFMAVYKICCCVQACRSLHSPESLFSNGSYHSQLLCARTTFGFGFIAISTDVILFEILQSCVLIIYIRRKHSFLKCSYQWFLIWLLFSGSLHCLKHRSYHQNISILPGKSNPYN